MRPYSISRERRVAAGGDVDEVAAERGQRARDHDRVVGGHAAAVVHPVGGGDAHRDRLVRRPRRRARRRTPRAGSACGSRGCRRGRRCAGWRAARGSSTAGSRAPCGARPSRSPPRRPSARRARRPSRTRSRSAAVISRGAGQSGLKGSGDGAMVCQAALVERQRDVVAFPRMVHEPLRPAWASWMPILARGASCTKSTMRRQAATCSRRVHAGAAEGDAALGLDVGHLGDDEAGAAERAAAEVDEVPVVDGAVDGRVLAHRRDDDAVGEGEVAHAEGREDGTAEAAGRGPWRSVVSQGARLAVSAVAASSAEGALRAPVRGRFRTDASASPSC